MEDGIWGKAKEFRTSAYISWMEKHVVLLS
jgi:hypothetical protein